MKRLFIAILSAITANAAVAQSNFVIAPDTNNRYSSMIRNAPSYVDARVLAAGVSEVHTVPAGVSWVIFSGDCTFYARPAATATVPAADVTDGTASERSPVAWRLFGETQISLIASTACVVTLSFYK